MTAKETRQDAIRATRGQIRFCGGNPARATSRQIEAALSEVRPEFLATASDNQIKLFFREFKQWQKHELISS